VLLKAGYSMNVKPGATDDLLFIDEDNNKS
jgi:hypothetical protein